MITAMAVMAFNQWMSFVISGANMLHSGSALEHKFNNYFNDSSGMILPRQNKNDASFL